MTTMKIGFISLLIALCCVAVWGCARKSMPESHPQLVGGYSEMQKVTASDKAIFQTACKDIEELRGAKPKKVRRQVVAGMNYLFQCKCNGKKIEVCIYKPLPGQGEPTVTKIVKN